MATSRRRSSMLRSLSGFMHYRNVFFIWPALWTPSWKRVSAGGTRRSRSVRPCGRTSTKTTQIDNKTHEHKRSELSYVS
ncbi:hypothetical protein JG688_00017840 [Phytophthora aleatoria]|uniref:Uncharacterized protein n=1 Tax=Phytophthora aleatoria TaxID=2496075 RepID=A0A8J5LV26_9STRA|nr:hypothetical protein JG688_00017840 [Phytophthora aleatoria]